MNDTRRWLLLSALGALLVLGGLATQVVATEAIPPWPHEFYGALTVDGQDVAAGSAVSADGVGVVPDTEHNPIVTDDPGLFGDADPISPELMVQGSEETLGQPLYFYVNGARAETGTECQGVENTFCYQAGEVTELDLSVPVYTLTVTAGGCAPVHVAYTPTVAADGAGEMVTATVTAGTLSVPFTGISRGTEVHLTVDDADACCGFDEWLVDGTETITDSTSIVVTIEDADRTVEASSSPRARLEADFESPLENETFSVGQVFTVTAQISNTCSAGDALTVTAELSATEGVTVSQPVQALGELGGGEGKVASWTVTAAGPGEVDLMVLPGGIDAQAEEPIEASNLLSDTVSLTVQTPAALDVMVSAPAEVEVGETFLVTGTVQNTGEAAAEDVTAELSLTAGADVVGDAVQMIGVLTDTRVLVWTVECTAEEDVTVTVTAQGVDANTMAALEADDSTTVAQQVTEFKLFLPIVARAFSAP